MVKLYCLNIHTFENDFDNILPTLSSKRIEKINKLKKKNNKLLSMGAEMILKYALWDNNKNCELEILEDEFKKPYINGLADFHFNISHSGEYIVCAISNKPVGVDIEKISKYNLKIAEKYFTKDEIEYNDFFKIWVHKESFVKAVGKGLTLLQNKINIVSNGKISNIFFNNNKYFFREYKIDDSYKLAVCSKDMNFYNEIKMIDKIHIL
jgi:4'-phosphopantetheinyl transferase